ncbi:MAG: phosphoglucosamine mutase, partial [Clostridia bacterium]|nr:phosphoglucosamine mutase [Clostridia bacterium]
IGRAAAEVISDGCRRRPLFIVGADTRMSSSMIGCAVMAGICSRGADVIDLGVVPTPAVAYLVGKYKADAGVMISASHNPAEFNGIKIFGGEGYKLPDALEDKIEAIVLDGESDGKKPIGGEVGKVTKADRAARDYIDHVKRSVLYSLDGMKVAIDCANGSASTTAAKLFEELGANATILHADPNGTNINDNCGSTHIDRLSKFVVEGGYDCGVAFDGDADRCLAVDENGKLVDGDQMMAVCALDLQERGRLNGNAVVGTIMTNFGFGKFCDEHGIKFIATKVGDRYVLEEMLLEDYSFGGEQSGHIIFRDFATTGDGQLTACQLLSLIRRKGKKLSELASVMTCYPQTMVNLKVSAEGKLKFYTDPDIRDAMNDAKTELGSTGRLVVRPSGTEPLIRVMAEGEDMAQIEEITNRVANVIKERLS